MTDDSPFIAHHRELDGATQPLAAHLVGVAELSKSFAGKVGLANQGELIGLLHDFGKYSEVFQVYLKSAVGLLNQDEDEDFVDAAGLKGKIDHSTAGAQLVWREFSIHGQLGQIVGQMLALCIASHHSGLIDCLTSDINSLGEDAFSRRITKASERTHLDEALAKADESVLARSRYLIGHPALLDTLRGVVGKIVTHDKTVGEVVICQKVGLLTRFLFSCLIDADRIDTADFEQPKVARQRLHGRYPDWDALIARLEGHLGRLEPRHPIDHLRQDISRHCLDSAPRGKGIYTLTVPTGGGKTLASLRFALHHANQGMNGRKMDRVIYVIPFTSIIDQNADVMRSILEPGDGARQCGP